MIRKRIEIFLQARMGSERLPGKVMLPILFQPMLGYQLERLTHVTEADGCVLLTSTAPQDTPLTVLAQQHGFSFFRGPEEDVLTRYYEAARKRRPDALVRICGDCPLIDPEVVNQVIRKYRSEEGLWDHVSNVLPRSYPRGLDVEIFSYEALERVFFAAQDPSAREHVSLYMYQHPNQFRMGSVSSKVDLSHHRWTVDTAEDFEFIQKIIENLYPEKPNFTLQDVLDLLKLHPEWLQINAHIKQKPT